jgi:dihydropteroate synthase
VAPRPRARVVGVVNATDDSFQAEGRHPEARAAIAHGLRLFAEGADWLDVGGESTRPCAPPVDLDEELRRVLPVVAALAQAGPVSIDTSKARVAAAALRAGARGINDVRGLQDPEMARVSADAESTVVMHSRGTPRDMGQQTHYGDLVGEVAAWLEAAARRARSPEVFIDPGIGFAKTPQQSLALLAATPRLCATGWPVYVGASRKSFIGHSLGLPDPRDRLPGSLAAVAAAWQGGASAFRVHDVAATRQLLDLLTAIAEAGRSEGG